MPRKTRISAKDVDTRILAIHALDQLIVYILSLDPDLKPSEATVLAAIAVDNFPELIKENPVLENRFREAATHIKHKRRNPQNPTIN